MFRTAATMLWGRLTTHRRTGLILRAWETAHVFIGISRRWRGRVVEAFGAFADDATTNESLQRAQFVAILRRHETDRVANGIGAARAADAVNVILDVHREVVVYDV